MDVAAHDALQAAARRLVREALLERRDEVDRALDLALDVGREAPVRQSQGAPRAVEPSIEDEEHLVPDVAGHGQPPMAARDPVELVAVHDQEEPAIRHAVDGFARDHDVAEVEVAEPPQVLVVIPRHQRDDGAGARLGEDLVNHVAVELTPARRPLEPPEVDDVADEVEELALVRVEKIEQGARLTACRAQVRVADPDGAEPGSRHRVSSLWLLVFTDFDPTRSMSG